MAKRRITVLLVDDQPIIGEGVRRMLAGDEDIDFHYCQDPTLAIRTAKEISPTVILQDLVMPEIDGLTLVRYFRANPSTRNVPLIVLSSKEEAGTKAEAFGLGANDYLVKLPDRLEVIARIRYHSTAYINLLERDEAQRELAKANHFIRKTFGRYLSDDIVDAILESPEGAALGGEKRKLTIVMSDLRGFTSTCERLPAEDVVNMLNIYLETMTEIILKHQGTIGEFIGDAILIIFGAPIARENDAQRAVACALEMQKAMAGVNERNRQAGYPTVTMGIGINTGEAVVGNIGSKKRIKYDIIGHNVNLTFRIESYTVGGQVFISPSTQELCGPILRIDDKVQVMPKGIKKPITVFDIGGIGGEFNIYLPEKTEVELMPLHSPLTVQFTILSEKHMGEVMHTGSLVKLDRMIAEIHTDATANRLTDIKLSLFDTHGNEITSDLYGKIIKCFSTPASAIQVHFTSMPPEAKSFFEEILNLKPIQSQQHSPQLH
ncbi:MAG: response regulator [Gammaproteobacteria bacterium]|nr:response regulator [Gammaproteobacteria bacterium]